jgi:hypothetical protein
MITMMKINYFLAALLLVPPPATPVTIKVRTHDSRIPPRALGIEGR